MEDLILQALTSIKLISQFQDALASVGLEDTAIDSHLNLAREGLEDEVLSALGVPVEEDVEGFNRDWYVDKLYAFENDYDETETPMDVAVAISTQMKEDKAVFEF
jgi:hypothetical protein